MSRDMAKTENLQLRVEPEVLGRLDRIAVELAKRAEGSEILRTTAARTALNAGIEALEERLGLTAAPKKGAQRKP